MNNSAARILEQKRFDRQTDSERTLEHIAREMHVATTHHLFGVDLSGAGTTETINNILIQERARLPAYIV
ncbi:hypothetical protein [Sedimenticola thiotaurini]|uniref:hypothetical protein n=1 Tax=Sedimenticola thiotaurini TaxID=1543721 RepID=UPI00069C93D9|nr:hypothetical protein [Sedimenticola thiotaurini]